MKKSKQFAVYSQAAPLVYFTVLQSFCSAPLNLFLADGPVNCLDCWILSQCQEEQFGCVKHQTPRVFHKSVLAAARTGKQHVLCLHIGIPGVAV